VVAPEQAQLMRPIVSFTSDFGLADPYVGTVKAVMLGICGELAIVDVTHQVAPQAILQAVFLTQQAWPYFPDGTVHLAVVDPGVGSSRRAIVVRTPRGYAVGPDNGVLSAALPESTRSAASAAGPDEAVSVPVPTGLEVREIDSDRVARGPLSATFHGRDLFGPAAARLAIGMQFAEIGEIRNEIVVLPAIRASVRDGRACGTVVHVDRFGNLVTSIRREDLPEAARRARIADREAPLVRTYDDRDGLIGLVGSSGYLEIAVANGSAARELGVGIGTVVMVAA
jgi:S-adenosylmethionine hydrolase